MATSTAQFWQEVDRLNRQDDQFGRARNQQRNVQLATQLLNRRAGVASASSSSSSFGSANQPGAHIEPVINADGTISYPGPGTPRATSAGGQTSASASTSRSDERALTAEYQNQLRQDGLEELSGYVDEWVEDGLTWPEILARLDDVNTAEGKVIDNLYPERRLRADAGKTPMPISAIRAWRQQAEQTLRAAGMPETFYDSPSDFTDWIVGDVDPAEFQERVGIAVDWAQNAPAEVRTQLHDLYGVDEGGIAAYVLDPSKGLPALERQRAAAAISGAGVRTGFGALSAMEAERLGSLGVTEQQAGQALGSLARSGEILAPLAGQQGAVIDRERQLAAVGGDSAALDEIDREARRRTAAFSGGGGFGAGREGMSGFGTAR